MKTILDKEGGFTLFLLGNEAIVRGALEAGVAYVSTYPGTPSSEIGDTFYRIARDCDVYFEYSTNEKVALEFAMGTSFAGARSLCAMKHVGLNVAADALGTVAYSGVLGGMVIISADDPGCHSSQNEQDNRYFGRLTNLPILEPATVAEALLMTKEAFELSERLELPVILRTTTRISHMRGVVTTGQRRAPVRSERVIIDPKRFVCIPAHARPNHLRLLNQMRKAATESERSTFTFSTSSGTATCGIITSGVSYNYVVDVISGDNLTQQVDVLKIGFSHPFPKGTVSEFLTGKEKILVVEELEPILEHDVKLAAFEAGLHIPILGKDDETLPVFGELNPDMVSRAVHMMLEGKITATAVPSPDAFPTAPPRPPTLCAGCPHRASYFAVLAATGGKALFQTDIGCYTLGVLPPLETAHHMVDMGSSINTAAAMSRVSTLPVFAFIGDSTFYHSGIAGLINAVHNSHKFIVFILDNSTTAMTGHQPHPGASEHLMRGGERHVDMEAMIQGCGVTKIRVVDPNNLKETIEAIQWAMEQHEVTVIISRAPCALLKGIDFKRRALTYRVNQELCRQCGAHASGLACLEKQDRWQVLDRSKRAILRHGNMIMTDKPFAPSLRIAPCTSSCPAGLCAMGYISHARAGNYRQALMLVREHIPFPSICGYVCSHPCENACIRTGLDQAIAIRDIKRFIADADDPADDRHYMVKKALAVEKTGKSVGIIGAGPAGMTAAHDLLLRGYQVTVYDRSEQPGGIMTSLIPPYRLPKDIIQREIRIIELMGATIKTGVELGKNISMESLQGEHDAVLLAIGAGSGSKLGIEKQAPSLFIDAFDMLERFGRQENMDLVGKKVAVIGGGNAAMDCARVARKAGAVVTVLYRRTREEMPAAEEEISMAEADGVSIRFLVAPQQAVQRQKGGHIVLQLMRLGEKDSSGRPRPIPIEGKTEILSVDLIVAAVGQQGEKMTSEIVATCQRTGNRLPINPETMETPIAGVFAAGDAVSGPSTIIWAINHGKRAAWGIDRFLRGTTEIVKPLDLPAQFNATWAPPDAATLRRIPRQKKLYAESSLDHMMITNEDVTAETERCLSCGSCGHCLNCIENFACPAIFYTDNTVNIDPTMCVGCGVCAQLCPNAAIEAVIVEV